MFKSIIGRNINDLLNLAPNSKTKTLIFHHISFNRIKYMIFFNIFNKNKVKTLLYKNSNFIIKFLFLLKQTLYGFYLS